MNALHMDYEQKLAYYQSVNARLLQENQKLRSENMEVRQELTSSEGMLDNKDRKIKEQNKKLEELEAELRAHEVFSERMGMEMSAMNREIMRALNRYIKDDCEDFIRSIELRFHQTMPWSLSNEVREFFVKNTKKIYLEKITGFYASIKDVTDNDSRELKRKVFLKTLSKETSEFINSNIMDIIGGHIENAKKMIGSSGTIEELEDSNFTGLTSIADGPPIEKPVIEVMESTPSDMSIRKNKNLIADRLKKSSEGISW